MTYGLQNRCTTTVLCRRDECRPILHGSGAPSILRSARQQGPRKVVAGDVDIARNRPESLRDAQSRGPAEIIGEVRGACALGPATVSVAYTHQFLFLDHFAPGVGSSLRLVGTSTMRNE